MTRRPAFALLAALAAAGAAAPAGAADPIAWHTEYAAARKEADEKKRPLLVVVGTSDCFYCRKMEAGTFADPKVAELVGGTFVALKVDAAAHPEFAKAMRVTVYPTTILAGADGKIHGFLAGYLAADQFTDNARKSLAAMPQANPPALVAKPAAPKPLQPTPREQLALAKEAYHAERFGECLERCDALLAAHADATEAKPALALLKQVQADPEKLAQAGDQLDERYAASYFALADAWHKQGKLKEAMASYEKAIRLAPNSKLADAAQGKLTVLVKELPDNRR